MNEKMVLIDGYSILHRTFYGLPDLTNAEGLHTNAIYGFLNILFRILDEEQPQYLLVAFDEHAPTFRHEMYREYKGTRRPMPDELREQIPVMREVLQAMEIPVVSKAGLEADDIIGILANRAEKAGMDVSVISGDRDLLQLATGKVKIRIPKTKFGRTEVFDYLEADVKEAYQVSPQEFIDVKALMGDASDNIPGVPSIGEKTATKIIVEYHSIENAYAHVSELKPPRAAKALAEHYDLAVLSKTLATICVDAELEVSFDDARLGELYTKEAYALFQRLQFKNFLDRFQVELSAHSVEESFRVIKRKAEAEEILKKAGEQETVAVCFLQEQDVLPLFAEEGRLSGVSLCFSDTDIVLLSCGEEFGDTWLLNQVAALKEKITTMVIFHLKEQLKFLDPETETGYFDAMLAAYLLNPLKSSYSCEDLAREHLDLIVDEKLPQESKDCYHAWILYQTYPLLRGLLKKQGMSPLYEEIELPLVFTLYRMEQTGVQVKAEELKIYGENLQVSIDKLEQEICALAGHPFNIHSPKQLGTVLFEELQIPGGKKTKTGYSTAADILEKLAPDYPIISRVLEYRTYTKLKSTYADGLANFIADDGRIHGKFHQSVTATGRISSSDPNLQNIPVRMELGRQIRKVFVPQDGYVFVDADYSQIELRILAHLSGDPELIQAYHENADIHAITASKVFHVPFEEVTPLMRRNAKAVNFGIVYGISSFGLSQDLSISRKEAQGYIEEYFATYPGIKQFLDEAVKSAKKEGYAVTMFGRRRPVPELTSSNFMQRSFGERVAMNSPIQGTAADIMKIAMLQVEHRLREENLSSRIVLQVHDELLIEAKEAEVETVKSILSEEMTRAAELSVALEIDMHTGSNWYEAK